MKMKKVLSSSFIAAMAAAAWVGFGATDAMAAAADNVKLYTDGPTVAVDTQKGVLTVSSIQKDKEIMFGVATQGKKSGKTTLKVAQWDIYDEFEGGSLTIDLSKLTSTKDNYVELKAGDNDPVIIKIPAADKASVVTYTAGTDTLEVKSGEKKNNVKGAQYYEYRTAYSNWTAGAALTDGKTAEDAAKFKMYQEQGATLYVRVPAYNTSASAQTGNKTQIDTDTAEVYDVTDLNTAIKPYVTTTKFPTKEVKLNIAKKANGPKVKADYVNSTVTIPRKTEYRMLKGTESNGVVTYAFVPVSDSDTSIKITDCANGKSKASVSDVLAEMKGSGQSAFAPVYGVIEARVKATDRKAASKWTRVELAGPQEIAAKYLHEKATDNTNLTSPLHVNGLNETGTQDADKTETTTAVDKTVGGTVKYGNKGVKSAIITNGETETSKKATLVTVAYNNVKATNGKYTGELVIKNDSEDVYQVVIQEKGDSAPDSTARPVTIKAKNTTTIKKVKDGYYVYIRKAGDNKALKWVGGYTKFGVVDFPKEKVVEKTPTTP